MKKDVIEFCNKLAQKLNYENLEFLNGNIKDYDRAKEVDLVFLYMLVTMPLIIHLKKH